MSAEGRAQERRQQQLQNLLSFVTYQVVAVVLLQAVVRGNVVVRLGRRRHVRLLAEGCRKLGAFQVAEQRRRQLLDMGFDLSCFPDGFLDDSNLLKELAPR